MGIDQIRTLPIERIFRSGAHHPNAPHRESLLDQLAVEEPLEIRIGSLAGGPPRSLSITMRTPGDDADLALGFLVTEGLLESYDQVERVVPCGTSGNVVRVELRDGVEFDWQSLHRNFYTTSSCGVCGKSSIEALKKNRRFAELSSLRVPLATICEIPRKLREAQEVFSSTGGLHAAALFTPAGELFDLKEDVGRHNALDKLIGSAFRKGALPLDGFVLALSGRASFELVQKAYMAGIQFVVAMGAPSSLAAKLAAESGITLVGFAKADRCNVYTGKERIGDLA